MSSIIIDKLKEIEEASKTGKLSYFLPSDSSTAGTKSESDCHELSREQTVSILTKNESDYYDEYHTAKVWARKLKSLTAEQRLYAEKAIYDVLFEAQLGNLNKSSVKINSKVYHAKPSHSIFTTAQSSGKSLQRSKSRNTCHSAPQNNEREYRSSEVMIAESFPTEIGVVSSECQVKRDNIANLHTTDRPRSNTYIYTASPLNIATPSNSHKRRINYRQGTINKIDSFPMNVATNTPQSIIMRLSRYLRYFYDRFRDDHCP